MLTWRSHIVNICSKVAKSVGMLRLCWTFLPQSCLLLIYYAYIHPYLTLGIEMWGLACTSLLRPIRVLLKKCIRIIAGVKTFEHRAPFAKNFNILLLYDLQNFCVLCLMLKINHNLTCTSISLFIKTISVHACVTRSVASNNYFVSYCCTDVKKRFITYQGAFNLFRKNIKYDIHVNYV